MLILYCLCIFWKKKIVVVLGKGIYHWRCVVYMNLHSNNLIWICTLRILKFKPEFVFTTEIKWLEILISFSQRIGLVEGTVGELSTMELILFSSVWGFRTGKLPWWMVHMHPSSLKVYFPHNYDIFCGHWLVGGVPPIHHRKSTHFYWTNNKLNL